MTAHIDLRNDVVLEDANKIFAKLGSFWTGKFKDEYVTKTVTGAAQDRFNQANVRLAEDIAIATNIAEAPLFHTEVWRRLVLLEKDLVEEHPNTPYYQDSTGFFGAGLVFGQGVPTVWSWRVDQALQDPVCVANTLENQTYVSYRNHGFYYDKGILGLRVNPFTDERFTVVNTDQGRAVYLWLRLSQWDLKRIAQQYALPLGVPVLPSTESYRMLCEGAWQARVRGPSDSALYKVVAGASGVPLCSSEGETVEVITVAPNGDHVVVTDKKSYRFPSSHIVVVSVGDVLREGQEFTDALKVRHPASMISGDEDITIPPELFNRGAKIKKPLRFPNARVPVIPGGLDVGGNREIAFLLHGEGSDLKRYRAAANAAKIYKVFDIRGPNAPTVPSAAQIAPTVNPAIDLVAKHTKPHLVLVYGDAARWPARPEQKSLLRSQVDKILPRHGRVLLQERVSSETYSSQSYQSSSSSSLSRSLSSRSSPSSNSSSSSSQSRSTHSTMSTTGSVVTTSSASEVSTSSYDTESSSSQSQSTPSTVSGSTRSTQSRSTRSTNSQSTRSTWSSDSTSRSDVSTSSRSDMTSVSTPSSSSTVILHSTSSASLTEVTDSTDSSSSYYEYESSSSGSSSSSSSERSTGSTLSASTVSASTVSASTRSDSTVSDVTDSTKTGSSDSSRSESTYSLSFVTASTRSTHSAQSDSSKTDSSDSDRSTSSSSTAPTNTAEPPPPPPVGTASSSSTANYPTPKCGTPLPYKAGWRRANDYPDYWEYNSSTGYSYLCHRFTNYGEAPITIRIRYSTTSYAVNGYGASSTTDPCGNLATLSYYYIGTSYTQVIEGYSVNCYYTDATYTIAAGASLWSVLRLSGNVLTQPSNTGSPYYINLSGRYYRLEWGYSPDPEWSATDSSTSESTQSEYPGTQSSESPSSVSWRSLSSESSQSTEQVDSTSSVSSRSSFSTDSSWSDI